jgi:hypothetical protein
VIVTGSAAVSRAGATALLARAIRRLSFPVVWARNPRELRIHQRAHSGLLDSPILGLFDLPVALCIPAHAFPPLNRLTSMGNIRRWFRLGRLIFRISHDLWTLVEPSIYQTYLVLAHDQMGEKSEGKMGRRRRLCAATAFAARRRTTTAMSASRHAGIWTLNVSRGHVAPPWCRHIPTPADNPVGLHGSVIQSQSARGWFAGVTGGKLFPCFILRRESINNTSLRNISKAFLPAHRIGDLR